MKTAVESQQDPGTQRRAPGVSAIDKRIFLVGGVLFAVEMVLSARYGFDRDELYFFDCARHLQASYVDQPVFTPLMARVTLWLFGVSEPGLRLWPALAGWGTVVAGGLTAREFGGGRRAQLLAAIGVAAMPALLAIDHLAGPTAFDMLAWAGLTLIVARIGRSGDRRWWLAAGLVLGLGLANKHSVGFLGLAVFGGALLTGRDGRRLVLNWWFAAGAVIAAALTVPDLWWQAQHGWATIAMTRQLNTENGGIANAGNWVIGQLLMTTIATIGVWFAGLKFLWRSDRALWRALAWAYGLLFVFFMVTTGGKIYYEAGAYVYLLAAGAVVVDRRLADRGRSPARLLTWTAVSCAAALPIVLPVLPAADIGWTAKVNSVAAESLGWPQLAGTVRTVWTSLPVRQRAHAVIFAADYGEAGAINELGTGLPQAVSGHNSYWWWGPGRADASTVVAVAPGPMDVTNYAGYLRQFFGSVRVAATIRNPEGVRDQEWDGHVYVCTNPRQPWAQIWPRLRHYD